MQKFNCIIVEDEPLATEVLQDYIAQVPFLELKESFSDALFATDYLQHQSVDLIFLDIHLPKLKGLDFISTLQHPPQIILTTAYHEYAIKGFELNVLDYLLKPIEFNRFLKAVNKLNHTDNLNMNTIERKSMFFNVNKKNVKIFLDEILYIESLKEYVRIVTPSKSIVTKFQLGQIETLLSNQDFIRIHRSYMISKHKIDAYTATDVEINGKHIPIGRGFKDDLLRMLENK
jgi:DNA-binding LytR/AlgR family response regulator